MQQWQTVLFHIEEKQYLDFPCIFALSLAVLANGRHIIGSV